MPSSLSLGLVMPSEVEHIRESGIFDLPALLSAVRERGECLSGRGECSLGWGELLSVRGESFPGQDDVIIGEE